MPLPEEFAMPIFLASANLYTFARLFNRKTRTVEGNAAGTWALLDSEGELAAGSVAKASGTAADYDVLIPASAVYAIPANTELTLVVQFTLSGTLVSTRTLNLIATHHGKLP